MVSVPLVDLRAQHGEIADEVAAGFAQVLAETAFIQGKAVTSFEEEYARFIGVGHCVGVANGTDALELVLRALDIGRGDEVVLPANTFVATAEAVVRAGATPVLVDVDPDHLLLDAEQALAATGPRTRAILPVHLYGQVAPVELLGPAVEGGVHLVEDAAQAQGARRHGRAAGALGTAAGTSYYPGKNLGAYGDAGAVTTDDAGLARRVRRIANHGSEARYQHTEFGVNSRLDTLQAVVLSAKLARLAEWNAARRAAADRYAELLADAPGVRLPGPMAGNEHVWHLYVVRVADRDRVLDALHRAGVGAAVHYPTPVHLHRAFEDLGLRRGAFPISEQAAGQILSLPIGPHLSAGQQEQVAAALRAATG
ncbi:MAG: DegT/DnrJ/EryC1/StrS family aminotransferase [Mycobacteriales bacterium]